MSLITAAPEKVPGVHYDSKSTSLSWEEPFNNFDPITNYIVTCYTGDGAASCSGCDVNATTRYCVISDFSPTKKYAFHVKAKNSIGIGEPGVYKAGLYICMLFYVWATYGPRMPYCTKSYWKFFLLKLANFSCPII